MSRRKAEMVLELVDRATRPARRFIAMQKRMGRIVEAANRVSARSSRTAKRATDLYTRSVKGLDRAQDKLRATVRRTAVAVQRNAERLRTSAARMRSSLASVGQAALLAGGLVVAYTGTVTAAGAAMLSPARQFEKFQTILHTTEGTAAAAQESMRWVEKFAVSTPYELDQVMEAFVALRAYGLDPTNGLLMTLGDTSAAMGKDVMQAVEAMADAVTGENERLKEFGIKASKVGNYFEYAYTLDGQTQTARALATDRAAIEQTLTEIFQKRYGGSMDRLSKTFDGMASNIADQWTKFQRMIMDAGVFDWMKSKLKGVLDELNRLEETGELQLWAERIADHILIGMEALWSFGGAAVEFWQALYPWLQASADALGGWRNLALALLGLAFRGYILGAAGGLAQFALHALRAGRYLAGIGFLSAAGGAARFGLMVLGLLNPLKLVRLAIVAIRLAIISTGIGAIIVGIAMAGIWIYNNWSGLVVFFQAFGAAFMAALGPARPVIEKVLEAGRAIWDWLIALVDPIDASAATWAEWGIAVGESVGNAVGFVIGLPSRILDGLSAAWPAVQEWMANMWTELSGSAQTAWSDTAEFFRNLWSEITLIFTEAWAIIETTVIAPLNNAVSFMTDNKLTRGVSAARAGIAEWWNGGNSGAQASASAARSAAAAGALAAVISGPATALDSGGTPDGARYLTHRSGSNTTVSAPVTLTINGNVDEKVMPDLQELVDRAADEVEERARNSIRWGHN